MCAAAGALGLLHRRLKGIAFLKTTYVTASWVLVCVGIPVASEGALDARAEVPVVVIGLAVAANLIASNLRDDESATTLVPFGAALGLACGLCAAGAIAAIAADATTLAPIPLLEGIAVAGLAGHPADTERYGLVVVDGALWAGALVSVAMG